MMSRGRLVGGGIEMDVRKVMAAVVGVVWFVVDVYWVCVRLLVGGGG